jgi:multiple sugar transport system substrate-binding protein
MAGEQGRNPGLTRRRALQAMAGLSVAATMSGRAAAQTLEGEIRIGFDPVPELLAGFVEETAAAVEEAHPGARLSVEPSAPGGFLVQLVLQLATGRAPDLFLVTGTFLGELAAAGYVAPLDDYLAAWDGWDQAPEAFRQTVTYDGSVWGVPCQADSHFVYYRRDIFAEAGLSVEWQPRTVDEILDTAAMVRDTVPGVIPLALYAGANGGLDTVGRGFVPLVLAYGGSFKDENGLWIVDSCAIRNALEFYARAYQTEGVVPLEVLTGASPVDAMQEAMVDGSLAIIHEGSWTYGKWVAADPDVTREQIGHALMPSQEGGSYAVLGAPGNTWFVNAASPHKDLCWAFIEAFNSVENQVALNLADPHIPFRTDAQQDPEIQGDPFLKAVVDTMPSLLLFDPDPGFRQIITIVQNATGIVATGEATPDEAVERYASELERVFGEENVVAQPCNVEL